MKLLGGLLFDFCQARKYARKTFYFYVTFSVIFIFFRDEEQSKNREKGLELDNQLQHYSKIE